MIDDYVKVSRRCREPPSGLVENYQELFSALVKRLGPEIPIPKLVVTYSMTRRCENVRMGSDKYLIFDQYMGQSLSQLNRILFLGEEADELMMSYAFKCLGEDALVGGDYLRACLFAASFHEIRNRLGSERFSASRLDSADRHLVGVVQECFVLAHELAHEATGSHLFTADSIEEEWAEIIDFAKGWARETTPFPAGVASPTQRQLNDAYEEGLKDVSLEERETGYVKQAERVGRALVPELVADRLACELAVKALCEDFGMEPRLVYLGIVLALRYLRIFQYLKNVSLFLKTAKPWSPNDQKAVERIETTMRSFLMAGRSGLESLVAWQLREKALRRQLRRMFHDPDRTELLAIDRWTQTHLFFCQENMEDEVFYFLPFHLARGAPLYAEARARPMPQSEILKHADELLGWPPGD